MYAPGHSRAAHRRDQMKRVMILAIALASTVANAASKVPAEMVGRWCLLEEHKGEMRYTGVDNITECGSADATLPTHAYSYGGHEFSCRFTAVKTWIDRSLPYSTKEMGAPVMQAQAECNNESCRW